jgi:hypothetical protein
MKRINYKGKGEHSVNELESIIEKQAEELHLIKSGQKPLIIDSVMPKFVLFAEWLEYNGKWTLPEQQVKDFFKEQQEQN